MAKKLTKAVLILAEFDIVNLQNIFTFVAPGKTGIPAHHQKNLRTLDKALTYLNEGGGETELEQEELFK